MNEVHCVLNRCKQAFQAVLTPPKAESLLESSKVVSSLLGRAHRSSVLTCDARRPHPNVRLNEAAKNYLTKETARVPNVGSTRNQKCTQQEHHATSSCSHGDLTISGFELMRPCFTFPPAPTSDLHFRLNSFERYAFGHWTTHRWPYHAGGRR